MSAFNDFANQIETEAIRLGLSNVELAGRASVSPGLITRIFSGKKEDARLGTMQALTKAVFGPDADVRLQVVTSADTPVTLNGTSKPQPGDVLNAVEAGLLRARNVHLEKENAALRAALRVIIRATKNLNLADRAAPGKTARPRGHR